MPVPQTPSRRHSRAPSWQNPAQASGARFAEASSRRGLMGMVQGKLWWLALALVVFTLGWLVMHLPETAEAQGGTFDTPSGDPVPRWMTIHSKEANARKGPSMDHDVLWTYKRPGLPVQVISETREWRLICDPDGGMGWVRRELVSKRRAVMTLSTSGADLRTGPNLKAGLKARMRPRTLAGLDHCEKGFCEVTIASNDAKSGAANTKGWVAQSALWGTQSAPACKRPGV
jgi:SH3-like domain-containing protein